MGRGLDLELVKSQQNMHSELQLADGDVRRIVVRGFADFINTDFPANKQVISDLATLNHSKLQIR